MWGSLVLRRVWVGAFALAVCSSASAADRFDLHCVVSRPEKDDRDKWDYSVDVVSAQWCLTKRCEPKPFVSATPTLIVLEKRKTIGLADGSGGVFGITTLDRMKGTVSHHMVGEGLAIPDTLIMGGRCTASAFTPFPKPKF